MFERGILSMGVKKGLPCQEILEERKDENVGSRVLILPLLLQQLD